MGKQEDLHLFQSVVTLLMEDFFSKQQYYSFLGVGYKERLTCY